jgi:hypothetical protein
LVDHCELLPKAQAGYYSLSPAGQHCQQFGSSAVRQFGSLVERFSCFSRIFWLDVIRATTNARQRNAVASFIASCGVIGLLRCRL